MSWLYKYKIYQISGDEHHCVLFGCLVGFLFGWLFFLSLAISYIQSLAIFHLPLSKVKTLIYNGFSLAHDMACHVINMQWQCNPKLSPLYLFTCGAWLNQNVLGMLMDFVSEINGVPPTSPKMLADRNNIPSYSIAVFWKLVVYNLFCWGRNGINGFFLQVTLLWLAFFHAFCTHWGDLSTSMS